MEKRTPKTTPAVDAKKPIVDGKNKVIGIHLFDKFIKEENKFNKVVIMAGGRGMRLRPLTKDILNQCLKLETSQSSKLLLKNLNKVVLKILLFV